MITMIIVVIMVIVIEAGGTLFEIVLFEISHPMKPCPSGFHAYTSRIRPVMDMFEPKHLDEVSNYIPPTSRLHL